MKPNLLQFVRLEAIRVSVCLAVCLRLPGWRANFSEAACSPCFQAFDALQSVVEFS